MNEELVELAFKFVEEYPMCSSMEISCKAIDIYGLDKINKQKFIEFAIFKKEEILDEARCRK